MNKFLLAIVILISIGKLVPMSSMHGDKLDLYKLTEQDAEAKKEGAEKGKNQINDDDNPVHNPIHLLQGSYTFMKSSKICLQQDEYIGFVAQPNTPPPDVV